MHDHHHGAHAPGLACLPHPDLAPPGACASPPAGLSPPQDDEGPRAGERRAFKGQGEGDTADCADTGTIAQSAQIKRLATLRAELARCGWTLIETPGAEHGAFTATRWGMARDLRHLDDVAAFARRVGAAR